MIMEVRDINIEEVNDKDQLTAIAAQASSDKLKAAGIQQGYANLNGQYNEFHVDPNESNAEQVVVKVNGSTPFTMTKRVFNDMMESIRLDFLPALEAEYEAVQKSCIEKANGLFNAAE